MNEQIPSHLIPVLKEYERQKISKIEEAFSINKDGMSRAERRALKRKLSKSNLKSSVSKFNKINKAKAIDLMKEVKDSLFLVKGMCIGTDEHFMAYMDLNIQRCEQATTITRTGANPLTGYEYEYEKEVRINLCLKHHNAKMFNSFHASEELIDDAENGGLCIMPTMEEGCLDYKKKENED